jgi:hypothetical protein
MVAITFSVMCIAACVFLIYVLANFHRELMHMRKRSPGESKLTDIDVCQNARALLQAASSSYAGEEPRTKTGSVLLLNLSRIVRH